MNNLHLERKCQGDFIQQLQEKTIILESRLPNHKISSSKSGIDYFLEKIQNIFLNNKFLIGKQLRK